MDRASLMGILIALVCLLGAFMIEGGTISALLVLPAAIIVFGGTIGATVVGCTLDDLRKVSHAFKKVFNNNPIDYRYYSELLMISSDKARREGVLSLESMFKTIDNRFLVKGLQLVVDGTSKELIKEILELEIEAYEKNEKIGYDIFMTAGGYAPTMGIVGTVMGMVTVLSNLSNPDELGGAIAVAFLATLYGIASANILWIPFANKIKNCTDKEVYLMEMIMEGILSIQEGENPRILRERINVFLPHETPNKKKNQQE